MLPDFEQPTVQHKAEVAPIFLAYKWVSVEGAKIAIMCVASAIVQALKDDTALDAIQPMRYGWLIYIHTITDCEKLVSSGITLAGRYIPLRSELCSNRKTTVKVTLKDLPLYAVSNSEVLEALHEVLEVESEVSYCNVWYEGRLTNI